jgi:hypothetical protein
MTDDRGRKREARTLELVAFEEMGDGRWKMEEKTEYPPLTLGTFLNSLN